jgi:hypothetical protein
VVQAADDTAQEDESALFAGYREPDRPHAGRTTRCSTPTTRCARPTGRCTRRSPRPPRRTWRCAPRRSTGPTSTRASPSPCPGRSGRSRWTSCRGCGRSRRSCRHLRRRGDRPRRRAAAPADHQHLEYQPGTAGVHTTAAESWDARTGVCQDVAHLTLLLVREMGVPARYVSGYLLPRPQTEVRQTVVGESHAWIEAWTGGWWGYHPTNDMQIGTGTCGSRLRRRATAQGHLLRRHRGRARRHGQRDPAGVGGRAVSRPPPRTATGWGSA